MVQMKTEALQFSLNGTEISEFGEFKESDKSLKPEC